jgi:hypothetical protein
MTLLSIFSAPKPFTDPHIATIQRNAIGSWTHLPEAEVFLVGEETGLAETAREFGVRHLSNVARNAEGTPLVSSIFALARQASTAPLLVYVNADILLMPDLIEAARQVMSRTKKFIIVGQRWDLDVTQPLDFSDGWVERLQADAHGRGELHRPMGSDYFIFPRDCFSDMPDFAIGRAGWDNWMIYKARKEGWPTVDASASIFIIHQNHDYGHLPGGQPHYRLPETYENIRLAGGREMTRFTLLDTNRKLVNGRLRRPGWNGERFVRWLETFPLLWFNNYWLASRIAYVVRRVRIKLGLEK